MVSRLRVITLVAVAASLAVSSQAEAQNAVLAEMYGRGVHAYYSGNYNDAFNFLSMAINNGSNDPRAYYFRGIVAEASGRSYEAESDWQRGAELEAAGGQNPEVGRALTRFQGSSRMKLEEIRQTARLQALAMAAARSKARYGELNAVDPSASMTPSVPMSTPPAGAVVTPPPVPDMGNPFSKPDGGMAAGEPKVESDDALEGAMDPFADDAPAAAGSEPATGADPFATPPADAGTAPAADPFATPPADAGSAPAADPFATPPADAGSAPAADPFATPPADAGSAPAADPFAAPAADSGAADAGAAMDDPFAN